MNLRELLLEFAGQNEQLLKLEEIITSKISEISVIEETASTIRVAPTEDINECVKKLIEVLDESGYEDYEIREENENIVISI